MWGRNKRDEVASQELGTYSGGAAQAGSDYPAHTLPPAGDAHAANGAPAAPAHPSSGNHHSLPDQPDTQALTKKQEHTLRHLRRMCAAMDTAFTIPCTNIKFGFDAMIGLIPFAGDVCGAGITALIVLEARRFHVSRSIMARMMLNQALDCIAGCVPILGDIWDVYFKANTRNLHLLEAHLQDPVHAKRADTCFFVTVFLLVFVLPLLLFLGIIAAIVVGILAALGKL